MWAIISAVFSSARPPFLWLTFSVVSLGAVLAMYSGAAWSTPLFALILLGALAAHISVNLLNEVHDARSGLDTLTQRTPFSGGSGALQRTPQALVWAESMGYVLLGVMIAIGVYFIELRGWGLFPLGLLGLLIVLSYTPKITRSPWLCLIAPGLGFGPLMVMGTYYVLMGHYSWLAFFVSLIPFFLVNNLLLLNQFPDYEADKQVGRRNLLIAAGLNQGVSVFRWFLLAAFLTLVLLVALTWLPLWALLGLLSLTFALPLWLKLRQDDVQGPHLHSVLAWNVVVNLTTPLLIALGLWLAMPAI
jgi:1,4-dihydroxy-2-naphthoate octaprenyltransferase